MTDLPPPLTPADSDLRDFRFMPLDVVRFAQSDLVTTASPEEIVAAILLWGASWHQAPAASLPDDDRVLSQLSGYGRAVAAWQEVKAGALRGFVKCSDGRLYHPVVAEKARDAWLGKLKQRWRTFCAAIRKHNERKANDQREAPSFEDWLEKGRPDRVVTRDTPLMSQTTLPLVARDPSESSHECHTENRSKGEREGEGEGEGQGDSRLPPKPPKAEPKAPPDEDLMSLTQRVTQAAGVSVIRPTALAREMDIVKGWRKAGIDFDETILPTIAKRLMDMKPEETVGSLALFDPSVLKAHSLKARPKRKAAEAPAINRQDDDDERIRTIRRQLVRDMGERTYGTWLGPRHAAMRINGVGLVVETRSGFSEDQLRQNFSGVLETAAHAVGIDAVTIRGIR